MPKAILHIGTMKTGTTSIQEAMSRNADALTKQGYSFFGPPMRHSAAVGPMLRNLPDEARNVLISDEGLWHFADSKRSNTSALVPQLKNYDVTVLIYLRRPDSFINSWFQQGLKTGTGSITMSQFLESPFRLAGMQFEKRIARFAKLFGRDAITLRPYERGQLIDGDAVADFAHCAGIDITTFDIPERANETSDTDSLLIRSLVQDGRPQSSQLRPLVRQFINHLKRQGYKGRRYDLLTQTERNEVIGTYKPMFESIQSEYGGGMDPAFFSQWPEQKPESDEMPGLRSIQEKLLGLESETED